MKNPDGGSLGISGTGDGAADDQPVRPGLHGLGRCHGAFLIVRLDRRGADAGRDQLNVIAELGAEHPDFLRRTNQSAQPGTGGQLGQAQHLFLHAAPDAQLGEVVVVHAGEHGDGEDERRLGPEHGGLLVGGVLGGGEHLGAARGVDGGHLYAKVGGGDDGLGHGVGDVVELQVEKHFRAGRAEFTDDVRPAADKQLLADLERADKGGEFLGEFQGLLRAGQVERDDDRIVHGGSLVGCGWIVRRFRRSTAPRRRAFA